MVAVDDNEHGVATTDHTDDIQERSNIDNKDETHVDETMWLGNQLT